MTEKPDHPDRPETPFIMERLLRESLRTEKAMEIATEDEFIAAVDEKNLIAQRKQSLAENPKEMAQELAYQAYESADSDAALDLVTKSLDLDPTCVDSLTVQAFVVSEDAGTLVATLEQILTVAETNLGEEFFAEYMGDFWPMVEARPYMRTVKQLAEVLWTVGRRFDAVAHYENLIDLDPEDHMGNASLLLGYYLSMGEVQRSWDLLEEFDDEENSVCAWAWVLIFLITGDEEAAVDGLKQAMELNPYVASLLVGGNENPAEEVPPYFTVGSNEEAHYTVQVIGEAWERAGEAQWWLHNVLVELGLIEVDDEDEGLTPN
jgi:tetratricopeptide (TPR) repeat protein